MLAGKVFKRSRYVSCSVFLFRPTKIGIYMYLKKLSRNELLSHKLEIELIIGII